MSKTEAEQALSAKGMSLEPYSADVYTIKPTYQLQLPDLNKPIPFNVQLTLSSGKLGRISLGLDTDAFLKEIGQIYALVDLVNGSMKKALNAKYGAPIEINGPCDSVSVEMMFENDSLDCKESWKAEGQTVAAWWNWHRSDKQFVYFLTYQGTTSDL